MFVGCLGAEEKGKTVDAKTKQEWKWYKSKEGGFKFKYPAEWEIFDEEPTDGGFRVCISSDFKRKEKWEGRIYVHISSYTCSNPEEYNTPLDEIAKDMIEFMKTEVGFGKDAKYEGPIHTALSGEPAVKIIVTNMYKFTGSMTGIKYIQLYAKKEGRIYDLDFEVNSAVPWGVPEEEAFWGWEERLPIFEEVIRSFKIL
jgi:hypothetical protein